MKKPIVMWDGGHGGKDPGALGPTGLQEKDVTLKVVKRAAWHVEKKAPGKVVNRFTRKTDRFLSLTARAAAANRAKAQVFVSVHNNSAKNPAKGIETFVARKTKVSYPLAESLQDHMTAAVPDTPDRGVKRRNFTVLTKTQMAAALAELEFIHTACGEERLRDDKILDRYAEALADGVLEFLGIVPSPLPEPEDEQEPVVCAPVDLITAVKRHAQGLMDVVEKHEGLKAD